VVILVALERVPKVDYGRETQGHVNDYVVLEELVTCCTTQINREDTSEPLGCSVAINVLEIGACLVVRFELAIEPFDSVLNHAETNHGHHEYEKKCYAQARCYGDQQA